MNFPTNAAEILPWMLSGWRIIALLVLVLAIGGVIWWAYSGDGIKETERKDAVNIGIDIGKNSIQANLVTNQEKEVNNAANLTNQAVNSFHSSVNRDSNSFSGDSTDKFCGRWPCDSTCGEWRRQHQPELVCD